MIPPSWMPFADDGRIAEPLWVFCILIVIAAVLFMLARNFIKSRPGRALIAVRDNQTSASVSGVNLAALQVDGVRRQRRLRRARRIDADDEPAVRVGRAVRSATWRSSSSSVSSPAAPGRSPAPSRARSSTSSSRTSCREWTLDQSGMPPGLQADTQPLFDWLENRQGGDAISGVFFGARPARARVPPPGRLHLGHAQAARPLRPGRPAPVVARRRRGRHGRPGRDRRGRRRARGERPLDLIPGPVDHRCPRTPTSRGKP